MSLMKTLAKVAVGVAMAKGVSAMRDRGPVGGASASRTSGRGGGGLLGQLGGALGGGSGGGGTAGGLGGLLGGRGGSTQHGGMGSGSRGGLGGALAGGGLGGLLSSLGGAAQRPGGVGGAARGGNLGGTSGSMGGNTGGGLDSMLGGLLGGGAAGGLLGQIAGQAPRPRGEPQADFGTVLNSQFDDERVDIPPTPEQDAAAGLMLRAMVQAAKADGVIDDAEREKLLGHLDGASAEERRFVQEEMRAPVDPEGLARQVPEGLEPQVYAMSLMAIDLDSRVEAEHLHRLATAMGLERVTIDDIHAQLGAPALYQS